MISSIIALPRGPRWRVLVAHQQLGVRHALRTLIEARDVVVVDAQDVERALDALAIARFDLLVLELDLPVRDGLAVMQVHRLLLAHERVPVEPPAVILTLAPEVRCNRTLTDHLRALGVAGCIDDAPRPGVAALVDAILHARADRRAGKADVA